ncbi:hypothetical protein K1T71_010222 [Dendrolimus kikuchii]|uniref:Uncharacterized protein n=1 Tax=Dendrolimus kikuchii TaxID=765133 RepID=A0ACC1CR00_9NEOP|nr:hypothetical protein K1T71_010222 [Dendrolimus kikuchii]
MCTRLFVGNLPDNAEANDLRAAFSAYGEITNLDLKTKSSNNELKEQKKFAFVTLSGSNYNIESCIKHFSSEDFNGTRLYVTRARESFLERLQREREQGQKKEAVKEQQQETSPKEQPIIKLGENLNPRKRKLLTDEYDDEKPEKRATKIYERKKFKEPYLQNGDVSDKPVNKVVTEKDNKKQDSEKKRLESMKRKRQEFRAKQMIIKTGLTGVDKIPNKKVIFSDSEEEESEICESNRIKNKQEQKNKNTLFDEEDSDEEVNFEIKKHFEGEKGQKVLDLQSRYKSDKRFTLDERFIEDNPDDQHRDIEKENDDEVEIAEADEKTKQLNILQDVLGVAIKTSHKDLDGKKSKPKLGMLRFDPTHPEHAKFLVPKEQPQEINKKVKKKSKEKQLENKEEIPEPVIEKVEVSKEQFYKVSETLKDAIAQSNTFSLRSLFPTADDTTQEMNEQETDYIPLETPKQPKVKNPLDPGETNPFVYDSSDSENEDATENKVTVDLPISEPKAVWKEIQKKLPSDFIFLLQGLAFFTTNNASEVHKERRELKSLVKKRIYNKERKNQMFQKKIGGRKKTMKKSFRKKS